MVSITNDREYRMLEIIDKLRICRANDLAWMAGYTDYTYCRKGLKKLEDMGLLQVTRDSVGANCYYLTYRGLSTIGKHKCHTYEISSTTNHALMVSKVCAWLCAEKGASVSDMKTDGGLRRNYANRTHCPDVVYDGDAYEVELNHKQRSLLTANILANEQFRQQIWIVPDTKRNIANNLLSVSKESAVELTVMKLSTIEEALSAADIHANRYHEPTGSSERYTQPVLATTSKYADYYNALEVGK